MTWQKWFLIGWIALSGLILVARTGSTRRYTAFDGVCAVLETAGLIWLVVLA